MVDAAPLIKILPIAAAAMMVPGPDFMMITSMALTRGRKAGIMAGLGIASGVLIYTSLCALGLSAIFAKLHALMLILRIAGGIYLLYLGVQLWRASLKPAALETAPLALRRHPFVVGFLTNMTNPKALAFFTSIFAISLPARTDLNTTMAIVGMVSAMPIFWFGFVACGLSTPKMRALYLRMRKPLDRCVGTFLAAFGLKLILDARD